MQKIFIVHSDSDPGIADKGGYTRVNEFMGETGFIISINPQKVASGDEDIRGRWLVVADNGKGEGRSL